MSVAGTISSTLELVGSTGVMTKFCSSSNVPVDMVRSPGVSVDFHSHGEAAEAAAQTEESETRLQSCVLFKLQLHPLTPDKHLINYQQDG